MMIYRGDLTAVIAALRPRGLLAITPRAEDLLAGLGERLPEMETAIIRGPDLAGQIERAGRRELAVVAETLEHLPKDQASHVLALLRDLYAKVVYAVVPIGRWPGLTSRWTHTDLIAHGLRRVRHYEIEGRPLNLYHYDIYDYKLTPDWLNSRYWANPGMWDKRRW